jgi:hypothetical protein
MQRKHGTQMCTYRGWVLPMFWSSMLACRQLAACPHTRSGEPVRMLSAMCTAGARFSQAKLGIVSRAAPVAGHECNDLSRLTKGSFILGHEAMCTLACEFKFGGLLCTSIKLLDKQYCI